ncbi:transcriptional regulator [Limosilactobacillus frumenti DSM 13145]|uniref:Transcriptional regulator n=1 Tax=Limosilactobacillus frumenti DSM 13145 TaxID=1423746 RepID=A0A0R1PG69_9LACO|nr:MerR family transcriptional regulator [Limosilactobacillus frumenti]KRL28051.1 transcriptional regulator [Limosilactobacillus frumenti DSM 13145]MBA2913456.1 MerR family transcriptional regulator [Limosilactobacillus frumenti]QFG73122.1 MerR family transcriptional regulator [Limosilactobacillus frumenti]
MKALAERFRQMMSQHNLRITMSQLSEMTGVSPSQLRYWEKKHYIRSEQGEKNQNHLFPIQMLYRVCTIKFFLDQGYTLTNAVQKAEAHRESIKLFRQFVADQQLHVNQTGPNKAEISIGKIAEDPETEVYATINGDKTELHLRKQG